MALTIDCEVLDNKKVRVTFSAPVVDDSDLEDPANYLISGGPYAVNVLAVEVQAISHPTYVDLTTSEQTTGVDYDLEVVSATPATVSYPATVLADNPVIYYRLDESAGPTAVNLGTLGSAYDGTYNGTPTFSQPGGIAGDADTAVRFNGSIDSVSFPTLASPANFTDFTIEMWVYRSAYGAVQTMMAIGGFFQLYFQTNSSTSVFWAPALAGARNFVEHPAPPSLNQWHHMVLTRIGSAVTYYLDGVATGTDTYGTAIDNHSGGNLGHIANDYFGEILVGVVDEPAFYDYGLTADRVLAHYLAGAPT